ncbi:MAG: ion channel [Cyanobacteria bacterium J06641_5]
MQPPPPPPNHRRDDTHPQTDRVWLIFRNGQYEIRGLQALYSYWRDPYYLLLTVSWTGFLVQVAGGFLAINTLFALAYLLGGDAVIGATPGSFWDMFFFSVQTLSSIGYGVMSPATTYAHIVATFEAMIGILSSALITGLAFARFTKPTARVIFSKVAVITQHDRVSTLMFRVMNQRFNRILEAQIRVYFSRDEITAEGNFIRRFYELPLQRQHTPVFALPWTVMHAIDANSPLYGLTPADLAQGKSTFIASLMGIDETVSQDIHARHTYSADRILWGYQFEDMFRDAANGHRYIDFKCFHAAIPIVVDGTTSENIPL